MFIHPEVRQRFYIQLAGTSKQHPELSREHAESVTYQIMKELDQKDTQMLLDKYDIHPLAIGPSITDIETIIDEQALYDEEEC